MITPNWPSGSAPIRCMCSSPWSPHFRASLMTSQGVLSSSSCFRATGRMTSRENFRTWSLCSLCSSVSAKSMRLSLAFPAPSPSGARRRILIDWSVSQSTGKGSGTCHLPRGAVSFPAVRITRPIEQATRLVSVRPSHHQRRPTNRRRINRRVLIGGGALLGVALIALLVALDPFEAATRANPGRHDRRRHRGRAGGAGRDARLPRGRHPQHDADQRPRPDRGRRGGRPSRRTRSRVTPCRWRRPCWCPTTAGRRGSRPRSSPDRRSAPRC